jgi:hypothetical protein
LNTKICVIAAVGLNFLAGALPAVAQTNPYQALMDAAKQLDEDNEREAEEEREERERAESRNSRRTNATADGFVFQVNKDGSYSATGGPCATADVSVYETRAGSDVFKLVKSGRWQAKYWIYAYDDADGLRRQSSISSDVNWSETLRDIGRKAKQNPEYEGELKVLTCLSRNKQEYVDAWANWAKANMHLCRNCN